MRDLGARDFGPIDWIIEIGRRGMCDPIMCICCKWYVQAEIGMPEPSANAIAIQTGKRRIGLRDKITASCARSFGDDIFGHEGTHKWQTTGNG